MNDPSVEQEAWRIIWGSALRRMTTAELEAEREYVQREIAAGDREVDLPDNADLAALIRQAEIINGDQIAVLRSREIWIAQELERRTEIEGRMGVRVSHAWSGITAGFAAALKDELDLRRYLRDQEGRPVNPDRDYSMICCPFHADRNPSLAIHAKYWHCFGCGQGGDIFDWLLVGTRVHSWRQAVELVAEYLRVPLPQVSLQVVGHAIPELA